MNASMKKLSVGRRAMGGLALVVLMACGGGGGKSSEDREPGVPTYSLRFGTAPNHVLEDEEFEVELYVVDEDGAIVSDFEGEAALSTLPHSTGGQLRGDAVARIEGGVARFYGLSIDHYGRRYKLEASTQPVSKVLTIDVDVSLWNREGLYPGRAGHAIAYDSHRNTVIVYGGRTDFNGTPDGGTYEWDGEKWVKVSSGGPAAVFGMKMVYDPTIGRTVLFGGTDAAGVYVGGTWEWDGSAWTSSDSQGPAPGSRIAHAVTYAGPGEGVVVFGGTDESGQLLGDVWQRQGRNWQVATAGPSARGLHAMCYDSRLGRVLMFGGVDATGKTLDDTWEFESGTWTLVDRGSVPARMAHAMTFDESRGVAVMHGGVFYQRHDLVPNTTWEWEEGAWKKLSMSGPSPRFGHAMVYDTAKAEVILLGGESHPTTLSGEWWSYKRPR